MSSVPRTQLQDQPAQRNADRLRGEVNDLSGVSLTQGNLQDVSLPDATPVAINHGLSGPANGFILAGLEDAVTAGYIRTVRVTSTTLEVEANGYGATINAKLWVF